MDIRCRITSGEGNPRESATENRPPRALCISAVRVKRCGKSAPRSRRRERHGKPHREQDRIGAARGHTRDPCPGRRPGRLHQAPGNRRRRGMAVTRGFDPAPYRTRLTGRLIARTRKAVSGFRTCPRENRAVPKSGYRFSGKTARKERGARRQHRRAPANFWGNQNIANRIFPAQPVVRRSCEKLFHTRTI